MSKMKNNSRIKRRLVMYILSLSLGTVGLSRAAFADSSWIGTGTPETGSGGYSYSNAGLSCDAGNSNDYRIDCSGLSWLYYEYVGGYKSDGTPNYNVDFKFPFAAGSSATYTDSSPGHDSREFVIDKQCAQIGGFWHFGINGKSNSSGRFYTNYTNWEYYTDWAGNPDRSLIAGDFSYGLKKSEGYYGHWSSSLWSIAKSDPYDKKVNTPSSSSVYHSLYYKGNTAYRATKSGDANTTVLDNYKEAYMAEGHSKADADKITSMDGRVWAFCYAPGMGEKVATYSATSKVKSGDENRTINTGTYTINFEHEIKRTDSEDFEVKNPWKIKNGANSSSLSNKSGASGAGALLNHGETQKINYSNQGDKAKESGSINPGDTIKRCQAINYYAKISSKNGNSDNTTSTAACGVVKRPYAKFTGSVTATVKKNSAKTNVTIPSNHIINLTDSDDGYYEISFTDTVKRNNNDGAGGNVKTQYSASRRETSTGGVSVATWNPTSASSSGDTNALAEGGSQKVFTPKVSGTLKYGESRTFCSSMSYRARQKTNDAMTAATGSEFCITIKRPNAKCAIDGVSPYGIKEGYNVGAIGIKNFSYKPNGSFSWTKVNINSTTHNLSYDDANVWAMPGDDIQFRYGGCAGAYYAIEMSGITGKGTHYSTAGWITSNAFGTDGSTVGNRYFGTNGTNGDGFLFKGEATVTPYSNPVNKNNANLAAITSTTPSPYAKWTTGYNGGTKVKSSTVFLGKPDNGDPVAEMYGDTNVTGRVHSAKSPSRSGYGGSTAGTYKICGTSSSDCMFKKQNVGSIIVQQLTWNYLRIQNAAVTEGPKVHSATGIVRVPYNYYLRPFVKNEDESGVVYLGETKDMYPGVAVFPRKNTLVHGGATYATITKETHASVRVYNQRTKAVLKSTSFTKRLNEDGKITTTAAEDTKFMPDGKISFDIIDNGNNWVGDKICTELTIWPIDSHETGNGSTVYGASANSSNIAWDQQYALSETGIMNADGTPYHKSVATSCSTIAKRPTMSVESSNAYSATTYSTGVYAKNFGGDKKYIFGSWSEYGVFGRLNLTSDGGKTFVSGAAIGYGTNINNTQRNIGRENNSSQGVATDDTGGKTCLFMTQTLINLVDNKCGTDKNNGTDKKNVGSDAMSLYRDNILERYGAIGKDDKTKKNKITDKLSNDDSRINLNIKADDIEKYRVEEGNANSIVGVYAAGNAVLDQTPKFATNTNKTIVYNVDGALTIRGNINDERNKSMSTISDPTGVIIIADKVWIDAAVDYINATIITRNVDDAEVNTCKTSGGTTIKIGTGNSDSRRGTLSSAVCYKTLVFDGPVFTSRIILNRTGGAGLGTDSIKRAEIFNLNMANYLWSFNQMTHYSQAVTTYSRELPTRY